MMRKKLLSLLILITLGGLAVSSVILFQHYRLKVDAGQESFCSINETVNCDTVYLSEYSQIGDIPVGALAFAFYFFLTLYFVTAYFKEDHEVGGLVFCFFPTTLAIIVSGIMAYFSYQLQTLCILCTSLYIINILLFLLLPPTFGISFGSLPSFLGKYFQKAFVSSDTDLKFNPKIGLHILSGVAIFSLSLLLSVQLAKSYPHQASGNDGQNKPKDPKIEFNPDKTTVLTLEDRIKIHFSQPAEKISYGDHHPYIGNPKAPIKVIEFSDFQCPYCKKAAEEVKPVFQAYGDDVVLYFANYPLDKSCNAQMQRELHKNACNAAKAAICAQEKNLFWEFHDLLFENQRKLSQPGTIPEIAKQLNLDAQWLNQCMNSAETDGKIQKDLEIGRKLGVHGTPAIFMNGRKLDGWTDKEFLEALIEAEFDRN